MTIMRVERVVYGVTDLDECVRFCTDFGLEPAGDGARFRTQLGQVVELRPADEAGLLEVVWGVDTPDALAELTEKINDRPFIITDGVLHTADETGFGVGLAVCARTEPSKAWRDPGGYPAVNRTGAVHRTNRPLRPAARIRPLRLCHVALNIPKAGKEQAVAFYTGRLGFQVSDHVRDVGVFLRAPGDSDHHTLLLGHRADRAGVNHTAYEVANVDEVIVGANQMIEAGWQEARRLGRHTVGSNIFRFIHAPFGGRVEFASDMDRVDDSYGPNYHEQTPPHTLWTLKSSRETT